MTTILKYEIPPFVGVHYLHLPFRSVIISAKEQHGKVVIYAIVDTAEGMENRAVYAVGTGQPIPKGANDFIDTVTLQSGMLMLHIFTN